MSAKKTIIHASQLPLPQGVASQAVGFDGLFFLSGQIGIDPHTHQLVESDVSAQAHQIVQNVRALLLAAGLDLAHVLKVTLYLKNMSDLTRVDEMYGEAFAHHPPARTVIEVSRLPSDALLALDLIAASPVPPAPEQLLGGTPLTLGEPGEEAPLD